MAVTKTLFSANDGTTGSELWVSDGTSAGTSLLVDIRPGSLSSSPSSLYALGNGQILFQASDGVHGGELWISDGTPAGTSMLMDLVPGGKYSSSSPGPFHRAANGNILFSASDGTHGKELWITDTTAGGTSMIAELRPGAAGGYPGQFTDTGTGLTVFSGSLSTGVMPFATDGTAAGTVQLSTVASSVNSFAALGNGKVVFEGSSTVGQELWITDGTVAGTSQVLDIGGLANNGAPHFITAIGGGKAVMQATDGTVGAELWVTDGTAGGTSMVLNINASPGNATSNPRYFTPLGNGRVLFQADDGTHGAELWSTDGTAGGTSMVLDINPGSAASSAIKFAAMGDGRALFRATDGVHGAELWITDGTAGGTSMVLDIQPGATGATPAQVDYFTPIGGGRFLFDANDGTHGIELWITDGTALGTSLVQDSAAGTTGALPLGLTPDLACFAAGTRILTEGGEREVEALRAGMRVPTASGRMRRVVWVGRTTVNLARHNAPERVAPVSILPGAFGPGMPRRHLLLSPDHAVAVGGVLIPVHLLVNGATILREAPPPAITYLHVELDGHDLLLAEGLAAESYLDTGNRGLFAGSDTPRPLHADFGGRAWDHRSCRPLLLGGAAVREAHAALRDRAMMLGFRSTADAAPGLQAAGHALPMGRDGATLRALVPAGCRSLRLVSRAIRPADVTDGADPRRLGVAVLRVEIDDGSLPLTGPAFAAGWHDAEGEGAWRWSNGVGLLHLPPADHPRAIAITLADFPLRYWQAPPDHQEGQETWVNSTAR